MSKGLRITLITTGVVVAAAALLLVGINLGQTNAYPYGIPSGWIAGDFTPRQAVDMMGNRTMGQYGVPGFGAAGGYAMPGGYGMMGSGMMGPGAFGGMMGGSGMMGPGAFGGMMGGYGMMGTQGYLGEYGMMGQGMMGGYGLRQPVGVEPLSIEQARAAVSDYLEAIDAAQLTIGEVMIFDNHAYVQVLEQENEIGAFELLVDPVTLAVHPEYGPNMMWNLKYGMMGGYGMMGMMAGGRFGSVGSMMDRIAGSGATLDPADLPIDAEQAIRIAQDYLDGALPGTEAESEADTFYGYYTIHVLRDGDTVGMLSVNASTGQVWLHSWHGELIEMSEHD